MKEAGEGKGRGGKGIWKSDSGRERHLQMIRIHHGAYFGFPSCQSKKPKREMIHDAKIAFAKKIKDKIITAKHILAKTLKSTKL